MPTLRRCLLSLALALASTATLPVGAHAASPASDPLGFHFLSSSLTVNEDAGKAVITVTRTDVAQAATVRYLTAPGTAQVGYDYTPVKSVLTFAVGQATAAFDVPIVDHGVVTLPKTLKLSLFGPSPIGVAAPYTATLTILYNDPLGALLPTDPLGLPGATTTTDPLAGARFFVDPASAAAAAAKTHPAIKVIADQPGTARFGSFNGPDVGLVISNYLTRAATEQPGTVPQLTTYRIVDGHCGNWADPPAAVTSYENFVNQLAQGIGSYRAVLYLEQDSLITTPCLSSHGLTVRMGELNYAIDTLKADDPHLVIYLDAGSADAVPASKMAKLLLAAGVSKIQGFFLDATHFDWTLNEINYGDQISKLTGGKHFVVNTGESGRGPLVPKNRVKNGNEVLCNPPGRGLGPKPTTNTGYPNVDAFAWLDNPGGSSGACVPGAPPTGVYWPAYALMLIKNANYAVR